MNQSKPNKKPQLRGQKLKKPKVEIDPWNNPEIEPYIQIQNISKFYGNYPALKDLSLDIYKEEFFSLLGQSGCGKTTLLRILAGFEEVSSGRILIDGIDMTNYPPHERPVNMMFQSYALFPHMTVEQNIAFGLRQEHVASREIKRRTEEALELVQMEQFAKRKPYQLSGGQRQRVALARSIVKRPKLLLLDEPLAALDRKLREETQFELVNIQEELGLTTIMVTHDQEEAMTMSTRISVLDEGHIAQTGTPTEIYEFPHTRYIADFIGLINMFEGRIVEQDQDHVLVQSEELDTQLYINHGAMTPIDTTVTVAIRPEKILIRKDIPTSPHNCVRGVVTEIAYLGDVSIYYIEVPSGKTIMATSTNLRRISEQRLTWDEEVYLTWQPSSGVILLS